MSWWKRKKCPLCKTVLKKKHKTGRLCLETAEGPLELEICMGCSTILDHSSEILERKYNDQTLHDSMDGYNGEEPSDFGNDEEENGRNDS